MDGWHVVYTNWGDGEPSDPEGTGGCVSMHADGKWYDDPCDNAYFTPCKQTDGKNNFVQPRERFAVVSTTIKFFEN